MPKTPIDYSNTHFYKIVCKDLNIKDCYVGHTGNFKERKSAHKVGHFNANDKRYNGRSQHRYLYDFIKDNGGWDNFDMILINTEFCNDALDARRKEREYIEQLNATLNQTKPYISKEERIEYRKKWTKDNEEHVKAYKQKHYQNMKEHYQQKHKENYENKKEEIRQKDRDRYNNDADYRNKVRQQNKESYERTKEKQSERGKQKYSETRQIIECECGCKVVNHGLNGHLKTATHRKYMDYKNGTLYKYVKCDCGALITNNNLICHKQKQKHIDYLKSLQTEEPPEQ